MEKQPETVDTAMQRIHDIVGLDVDGDGLLSRVIKQIADALPGDSRVHGVTVVVATHTGEDDHLVVLRATDVWSSAGAHALYEGMEAELSKVATAILNSEEGES